ncbi:MAG: DUF4147 domain-containing protein [Dehalococcoidia bacterium]|nr:DUF4147 domain-containing protein [Dehalococcoidia bacterium]
MYVKNGADLLSHGNRALREAALSIVEYALHRANPYRAVRELVRLEAHTLLVGDLCFDMRERGTIYVLGAGKASLPIAQALEDVLGDRIAGSLVIVKEGQESSTRFINLREASHPIPDARGFEAAKEMRGLATQAGPNDIVFCAFTGGSSALAPYPVAGLTIDDKAKVHRLLLESGASIRQINAVRKHLSQIKGGHLALDVFPAEIVNLTVSDVTGDPYDYITCPTVPDTSTFDDARQVLDAYHLWDSMPAAAANYLQSATPAMENPRDFGDQRVHTFLLVRSGEICDAAAEQAARLGFAARILTHEMEGDSTELGRRFGEQLSYTHHNEDETNLPAAIIAGGETTVTLNGEQGQGGPNQEFALSAALALSGDDMVVLAIDTDGTDGPTGLAGAMTDTSTIRYSKEANLDIMHALEHHNVSPLLTRVKDAVVTGHTGTNVNDLKLGLRG